MLRYGNSSFFSTLEDQPSVYLVSPQNVTEQAWFRRMLGETMDELAKMASTDSPNDQFVKGECNPCLRIAISYWQLYNTTADGDRVLIPSCNIRYEIYPFYRQVSPPALAPPPISLTRPRGVRISKKSYDPVTEETDAIEITDVQSLQFDLGIIQAATNNFSNENKIGQGRFGMVYKGILANGQEKAVKRLSKSSRQGELEFKNEVVLVAKLRNRNLVRLLGFCLKGEEKILVYEYVHNKSLDYFLFVCNAWHFSVGSDVFSFGILVFEIISGKKNSCFHPLIHSENFLTHAWKMWKDGTPLELMDPTLVDSHVRNEVMKCIQMGLFCVQEDVDSRPSMAAIVLMLGRYTVSLSLPE
ncbi:hypothetical protein LguiB_027736 [Lonicera macranthoides]